MNLVLLPYIFLVSVSSLELISYRINLQHVSMDCQGLVQHNATFRRALSYFDNIVLNSVKTENTLAEKLPRCLLSHDDRSLLLEGVGEISEETIANALTLLQSDFDLDLVTLVTEYGYLKMYGTIFQHQSYVKAVANMCRALKAEPRFRCYFVDVIKDPSVLVTNHRQIPWIEIQTLDMQFSIFMDDPYPNLWKFMKQAGIAHETKYEQERASLTQCIDDQCSISLARDELLYSQEYWIKEIKPHLPMNISYLSDTSVAECPVEVLKLLTGERNSLSIAEIVSKL